MRHLRGVTEDAHSGRAIAITGGDAAYLNSGSALEGWLNAQIMIEGLKNAGKEPTRERLRAGLASIRALDRPLSTIGGVQDEHAQAACAQGVTDAIQILATSLDAPYVGPNAGYEAVQWLAEPTQAASLALLALRAAPGQPAFGLLVLASPDAQRFNSQMGTDLLERLAELIRAVTVEKKPRRATKPSRSSQAKRVDSKKKQGQTKALRGKVDH